MLYEVITGVDAEIFPRADFKVGWNAQLDIAERTSEKRVSENQRQQRLV